MKKQYKNRSTKSKFIGPRNRIIKNKLEKLFSYHLQQVVQWIALSFTGKGSIPVALLTNLIERLKLVSVSRGEEASLEFVKNLRGALLNYLSGDLKPTPEIGLTKDGVPKFLGPLIPYVRERSHLVIAGICTVLWSTRSLKIGKDPNFDSITQPATRDVPNISMFMGSFWRELGYNPCLVRPRSLLARPEAYRSKSGPNGHALLTARLDANQIPESLRSDIVDVGGPRLGHLIDVARAEVTEHLYCKFFPLPEKVLTKVMSLRRLSSFKDKEAKIRIIGILDWYSQLALKPLHLYLARACSKIRQDCTLDQSNFKNLILGQRTYHSIDLSNATDRFPIALISNLLKAQLPETYVDAWKRIMVGYPFDTNLGSVSYSVGNPMGAYSSFASFALCHHYLIYYCCKVLGKSWKGLPYALLGDDIVICDDEVAAMYLEVISSLGLEYSKAKTHKSLCFFWVCQKNVSGRGGDFAIPLFCS
jgi:hypothetical protein